MGYLDIIVAMDMVFPAISRLCGTIESEEVLTVLAHRVQTSKKTLGESWKNICSKEDTIIDGLEDVDVAVQKVRGTILELAVTAVMRDQMGLGFMIAALPKQRETSHLDGTTSQIIQTRRKGGVMVLEGDEGVVALARR